MILRSISSLEAKTSKFSKDIQKRSQVKEA